jgi:hypothetical protein
MAVKKFLVTVTFFAEATKTGRPTKWSPAVYAEMMVEAENRAEAEEYAKQCVREERYDHMRITGVCMMAYEARGVVVRRSEEVARRLSKNLSQAP